MSVILEAIAEERIRIEAERDQAVAALERLNELERHARELLNLPPASRPKPTAATRKAPGQRQKHSGRGQHPATLRACAGCGKPFMGKARAKWCSERCRKAQYAGVCVECGGPVCGTTPGRGVPERCAECSARRRREERRWTPQVVIGELQAWARDLGRPLVATDGLVAGARVPVSVVRREFGSWNAGLEAAGLPTRRQGRQVVSPTLAEEVLEVIARLEPIEFTAILEHVSCDVPRLRYALGNLRERRLIDRSGPRRGNSHGPWCLQTTLDRQAAMRSRRSPQAKVDVLQTIRNEPGKWSEQRIAATGAWDREDVADACGELLADGVVELLPDGTYAPCEAVAA